MDTIGFDLIKPTNWAINRWISMLYSFNQRTDVLFYTRRMRILSSRFKGHKLLVHIVLAVLFWVGLVFISTRN